MQFWRRRGHWSEGRAWAARAAAWAHAVDTPARLREKALGARVLLAYTDGGVVQARQAAEEWLAVQRSLADSHGIVAALTLLGDFVSGLGDYRRARSLLQEALALAQRSDFGIALPLS